jgi:hypothetical protein
MITKKARVKIVGTTPLVMNCYTGIKIDKKTAEEQAETVAYRKKDEELYIPGKNIHAMLICAALYSKAVGKGRASLQKTYKSAGWVTTDVCPLGQHDYEILSARVVNPATKGAVMRYRPELKHWDLWFDIEWYPDQIPTEQIKKVIEDAGRLVGLGDWRPACGGYRGRYVVSEFLEIHPPE